MAAQEDGADLGERARSPRVTVLHRTDVPATADQLYRLRLELSSWATAVGVVGDLADAVILAADEAMSNAVSHAYDGTSPGTFDLHATLDAERAAIHVTVTDRGRWQEADPDPGPLHGRGLILIRTLAHEATFDQTATGTTVRMTWLLA